MLCFSCIFSSHHDTQRTHVKRCPPIYQLTLIFWRLHIIRGFAVLSKAGSSDKSRSWKAMLAMQGFHINITMQQWDRMKQQKNMQVLWFWFWKNIIDDSCVCAVSSGFVSQMCQQRKRLSGVPKKEWHWHPPSVEANQHHKMGKAHQELTVYLRCRSFCPNVPVRRTNCMADNGVRLQGLQTEKLRKVAWLSVGSQSTIKWTGRKNSCHNHTLHMQRLAQPVHRIPIHPQRKCDERYGSISWPLLHGNAKNGALKTLGQCPCQAAILHSQGKAGYLNRSFT